MKNKSLLYIILIAIIVAVVTVVVLKSLGYENTTVTGGAIAGGVVGALAGSSFKKK